MLKQRAEPQSLAEAIRYFAKPEVAFDFVVKLRWPNGVVCPHCGVDRPPMFLKSRSIWKCRECRKQFSVKAGTIFEDSPLGLDKWLPALWMLANCRNGISSYELARDLGVTQKTAWFMLGRIRLAMQTETFRKFGGTVEMDDTLIGGASRNMHRKRRKRLAVRQGMHAMTGVFGMVERGGYQPSRAHADVMRWVSGLPISHEIAKRLEPGTTVYTDESKAYRRALRERGHAHEFVNHRAKEYVRGEIHTNSIENLWSCLKRAIKGTYISVDPFHLHRYVTEQLFRFNVRGQSEVSRFAAVARDIIGKRLTYAQLIGANLKPATT